MLQVVPDVRLQSLPLVLGAVSGVSVVDGGSVLIGFDHHVAITHSALEKKIDQRWDLKINQQNL